MKSYISALLVALGLLALGLSVRSGLKSFTDNTRTVDVRGLAEREVPANHVTWPIVFKLTGNDLPAVYSNVNSTNAAVVKFLKDNGLADNEISVGAPKMDDNSESYNYKPGITPRYSITSIVTVSSDQVDKVRGLILRQGDLLSMGIPVQAQDYSNSISYDFTGLNDIKPEMIAEATRNAREAAVKFAEDSGSGIGKIKSARQGQFSIENRDEYTPYIKTVRVVTSLTYYIDN
ncbi:MAG: SIMPL domain-containing protein [Pseudoflavonifractor sp.]|nr:SIMPL domain-containing protein [Alloprevotella sp.]MCM1115915.1 SIMPL domain-containing protein [Pseudoflavonifractor sp.]